MESTTFAAVVSFAITFVVAGIVTSFVKPVDPCLKYEQRFVAGHFVQGPKHHQRRWVDDALVDVCVQKSK